MSSGKLDPIDFIAVIDENPWEFFIAHMRWEKICRELKNTPKEVEFEWPDWANYMASIEDGYVSFFQNKPELDNNTGHYRYVSGLWGCGYAVSGSDMIFVPREVEKELYSLESMVIPDNLSKNTKYMVINFAEQLAAKLRDAEIKWGYTDGWLENDWMDECRLKLSLSVQKGDPLDVAAYCAFLNHHGESTIG